MNLKFNIRRFFSTIFQIISIFFIVVSNFKGLHFVNQLFSFLSSLLFFFMSCSLFSTNTPISFCHWSSHWNSLISGFQICIDVRRKFETIEMATYKSITRVSILSWEELSMDREPSIISNWHLIFRRLANLINYSYIEWRNWKVWRPK